MTKIPDFAFQNCRRLLGLGFADRVNWNEFNMDSLFCEPNIKTIGKYSFSGCKKLLDACVNDLLKHATIVKEGAFKNSKVSYSSYQDDYGQVDAAIMIPATLTVLEKESLGFNGENRFYFINDNPNNA